MLGDQDKEFKNAILSLPQKEKDRLLLKLIGKNKVLSNQLRYQLLESEDLDLRRESAVQVIDDIFQKLLKYENQYPGYLTPGQFMMELRAMSGIVNDHVLTTKDKLGDVELRLYLIESLFRFEVKVLLKANKKNQKLLAYVASRMKYILDKYSKLHEDHQFDLRERINKILIEIKQSAVNTFAEEMMLPQSV